MLAFYLCITGSNLLSVWKLLLGCSECLVSDMYSWCRRVHFCNLGPHSVHAQTVSACQACQLGNRGACAGIQFDQAADISIHWGGCIGSQFKRGRASDR